MWKENKKQLFPDPTNKKATKRQMKLEEYKFKSQTEGVSHSAELTCGILTFNFVDIKYFVQEQKPTEGY